MTGTGVKSLTLASQSAPQDEALEEDRVNFAHVRQIEDLFRHRWDAMTLLCLADGSSRYSALADAISKRSDQRIPDAMLTRCLRRLTECDLVGGQPDAKGHVYTLTQAGHAQVAILARFSRVMRAADRDRAQQARRATGTDRRQAVTAPREGPSRRAPSTTGTRDR